MFGNLGELAKLMSKVKDIQGGMKSFKEELPKLEFKATSAGGKVSVTVSGDLQLKHLEISPDAEKNGLEAEITSAFNAAVASAKMTLRERMKELTGGIGIDLPL